MGKKKGTAKISAALGLGLMSGLIVTIIGALITAWLIQGQVIGEDTTGLVAMVIILLSAAVAAAVTAGKGTNARLLMCFAGGGVYFLALLCIAAMVFDGIRGGVIPSACITAAGSILVYLLGMKSGRNRKYRVPRIRL